MTATIAAATGHVRIAEEAVSIKAAVPDTYAKSTASGKTGGSEGCETSDGRLTPVTHQGSDDDFNVAGGCAASSSALTKVDVTAKASRRVLDVIAGVPEYSPSEQYTIGSWRESLRKNFERFGFSRFTPDPVASNVALGMKGGLSHEMYGIYRINNTESAGFGPPFDRTLPLALYVARHPTEITYPWGRYDINNSWRAESPAPGRFRIFEQADVDFIDRKSISPEKEADCLGAIVMFLQEVGITDFSLCINHLSISKALLANIGVPDDQIAKVLHIIDKIEKIGLDAVLADIILAVPGLEEGQVRQMLLRIQTPVDLAGDSLADIAGDDIVSATNHLKRLVFCLTLQGIDPSKIKIRPSMVRGLDYYTGFVFETFLNGHERYGSIASGGAYDNLVGSFNPSAKDICGCGGSIGLTRLFYVMREIGAFATFKRKVTADLTVLLQVPERLEAHAAVTAELRRLGYRVAQLALDDGALKKQLTTVNKSGCPYAVIVREDGTLVLKNMMVVDSQTVHPSTASLIDQITMLGLSKV